VFQVGLGVATRALWWRMVTWTLFYFVDGWVAKPLHVAACMGGVVDNQTGSRDCMNDGKTACMPLSECMVACGGVALGQRRCLLEVVC